MGREDAQVALGEHGGRGARDRAHGGGRGLEGGGGLQEGKGNNGGGLHDYLRTKWRSGEHTKKNEARRAVSTKKRRQGERARGWSRLGWCSARTPCAVRGAGAAWAA